MQTNELIYYREEIDQIIKLLKELYDLKIEINPENFYEYKKRFVFSKSERDSLFLLINYLYDIKRSLNLMLYRQSLHLDCLYNVRIGIACIIK